MQSLALFDGHFQREVTGLKCTTTQCNHRLKIPIYSGVPITRACSQGKFLAFFHPACSYQNLLAKKIFDFFPTCSLNASCSISRKGLINTNPCSKTEMFQSLDIIFDPLLIKACKTSRAGIQDLNWMYHIKIFKIFPPCSF